MKSTFIITNYQQIIGLAVDYRSLLHNSNYQAQLEQNEHVNILGTRTVSLTFINWILQAENTCAQFSFRIELTHLMQLQAVAELFHHVSSSFHGFK